MCVCHIIIVIYFVVYMILRTLVVLSPTFVYRVVVRYIKQLGRKLGCACSKKQEDKMLRGEQ